MTQNGTPVCYTDPTTAAGKTKIHQTLIQQSFELSVRMNLHLIHNKQQIYFFLGGKVLVTFCQTLISQIT